MNYVDVIDKALITATEDIDFKKTSWSIINVSPRGHPLTHEMVKELMKAEGIVILCGRFEGIDQRAIDKWEMKEISLGDFVLTGGEIAAQAIIDATVRNLPQVLGNELSTKMESFNNGLLEYPQYTKPSNWEGSMVPAVLRSGNHQKVAKWQIQKSIEITKNRRPDLMAKQKKPKL